MENLFEINKNLYTYIIPLGYKAWDLMSALLDQGCKTDKQFVDEAGKIVEDMAYLTGKISGIELTWNKAKIYEGEKYDLSDHLF